MKNIWIKKQVLKPGFTLFFLVFLTMNLSAEDAHVVVEISNIIINGGKVSIGIFSNAEEFKKEEPYMGFELESTNEVLFQEVLLPHGEYVISAYQDTNNNGKLDTGLFGIPKELVGISNYFGKGFPSGNFNKQKIPINDTTGTITIGLYKLRLF